MLFNLSFEKTFLVLVNQLLMRCVVLNTWIGTWADLVRREETSAKTLFQLYPASVGDRLHKPLSVLTTVTIGPPIFLEIHPHELRECSLDFLLISELMFGKLPWCLV